MSGAGDVERGPRSGVGAGRAVVVLAVVLTLVSSLVGPAGAQVATPAVGASSSSFVGLPPLRLLDTRSGVGAPVGKLISGESLDVQVAGRGGVPRDAVAVALNVTVTDPTGPGWLTAHAAGTAVPGTSNLNFVAGQTVPNLVVASVGLGGAVSISAAAGSGVEPPRVHVVADVFGYFVNDTGFSSVDPTRLLDTRSRPGGAPVPRDGVVPVPVAGLAGVPADAGSVAVTFTVTSPTGGGWLTGYPSGAAPPATSNLNFVAGQTVPNLAVVKVGAGGAINVKVGAPAGAPMSVHVVIDVLGWFPAGGDFTGLAPQRLLDTRSGTGAPSGPVGSGGQVELVVGGRGGVPVDAGTVVLNLTVTSPTGSGWLTGFPTGGQPPPTSNVNFSPGQTVANLVAVKVGAGGKVTLRVQPAGAPGLSTHIVADVFGYFDAGLDDTIAPTVAITSPVPGASVVAAPLEIEVSGTAGDAVGVASVQLEVAGQEIIAADVDTSVAPATWKADLSPPAGTHTVTAVARDLAGNATSTTRTFTVSYPTAPLGVVQDPDVVTPADGTIAGVSADELRLDDSVTVEVGDTIAVGPTTNAPDGLLRTVVSREVIGGETVVATEPATVTDVIQRGFVEFGGPVEAEPGASAPASGLREWAGDGASSPLVEGDVGSSLTLGGKLEAKKNVGSSCPPEPITPPPTGLCTRVKVSAVASMSVGLELQGALDVGFKTCICWDAGPYIQRFKLALEGSLSSVAALKAEASFEIAVWENQKPDLSATLARTPIWGPLYLSSQFEARIKASINLKAALEASYETIDTVTVGAEYTESGGWRDLNDHDRTGTGTLPEVSGELSATGRVGIELNFEFLINEVAGPTMTITPYVQLTLSASTTSAKPGFVTGRVLLEAGITVGFGAEVEIPVINKTLAKYGPKTVLEAKVVLVNESREIYLGGGASALTVNGAAGAGTASKDAATGAVTGTVLEAEVVRGQAHEVVLRRTGGGLPVCGSIRTRAGEKLAGINLRSGDPTRVTFTRPVSADNPGGSETTRVLFVMEPCSGANPGTATVEVWLSTPVDIGGAVTGSAQPVPALRPGQTGKRTVALPAGATGTLTASGQCPTFSAVIVLRNADGTSVDGPLPNGCIPGGAINKTWDITGGTRTFEIMSPNGLPAGVISTTFTVVGPAGPPLNPPTGLALSGTSSDGRSATLSWIPVDSTTDRPVTGYEVRRGGVVVASPQQPTATVTGLTPGSSETVTVAATNSRGAGPLATMTFDALPTAEGVFLYGVFAGLDPGGNILVWEAVLPCPGIIAVPSWVISRYSPGSTAPEATWPCSSSGLKTTSFYPYQSDWSFSADFSEVRVDLYNQSNQDCPERRRFRLSTGERIAPDLACVAVPEINGGQALYTRGELTISQPYFSRLIEVWDASGLLQTFRSGGGSSYDDLSPCPRTEPPVLDLLDISHDGRYLLFRRGSSCRSLNTQLEEWEIVKIEAATAREEIVVSGTWACGTLATQTWLCGDRVRWANFGPDLAVQYGGSEGFAPGFGPNRSFTVFADGTRLEVGTLQNVPKSREYSFGAHAIGTNRVLKQSYGGELNLLAVGSSPGTWRTPVFGLNSPGSYQPKCAGLYRVTSGDWVVTGVQNSTIGVCVLRAG